MGDPAKLADPQHHEARSIESDPESFVAPRCHTAPPKLVSACSRL